MQQDQQEVPLAAVAAGGPAAADTALHTAEEDTQQQLHFAPAPARVEDTRGTHQMVQQAGSAVRHMHSGSPAEGESAGVRMAETA